MSRVDKEKPRPTKPCSAQPTLTLGGLRGQASPLFGALDVLTLQLLSPVPLLPVPLTLQSLSLVLSAQGPFTTASVYWVWRDGSG